MKKIIILIVLFTPCISDAMHRLTAAVDTGIIFEKVLTWEQVKEKAKAEHKYIFMDCYATWCGPCKFMSQNIFPQKVVGDFFNSNFINVSVQMDQTKNDSEETITWYMDATDLAKQYSIDSYPTFLFFDENGQAVHRTVGATGNDVNAFIQNGQNALNVDKQYYTLVNHYKEHSSDSVFLKNAITSSLTLSDKVSAEAIAEFYLRCVKSPLEGSNISILMHSLNSVNSKVFNFLYCNAKTIDAKEGKNYVEDRLRDQLISDEFRPLIGNKNLSPNWVGISAKLYKRYPLLATRTLLEGKLAYYGGNGDWADYGKTSLVYMKAYVNELGSWDINSICWDIFQHCNDLKVLHKAVAWSERAIDLASNEKDVAVSNYGNYVDTYANLLYKTGDKDGALTWETRALNLFETGERNDKIKAVQLTIAEMQSGKKTW